MSSMSRSATIVSTTANASVFPKPWTCSSSIILIVLAVEKLGAKVFAQGPDVNLPVNNAIWCNLTEHFHGIEPCFHTLKANLIVNLGYGNALDFDDSSVGFRRDFLSFAKPKSASASALQR